MHCSIFTSLLGVALLGAPATFAQTASPVAPPPDEYQPRTLAGSGVGHHGFFVAPVVQLGPAQGTSRLWVGGRVAYQINHRVALGFGGYGLATEPRITNLAAAPAGSKPRLGGGYGGFMLEYTVAPAALVHVSFPLLVGAGGAGYWWDGAQWNGNGPENDDWDNIYDADAFFVVEPGVNVEVNITRFLRLTGGAAYRYVDHLNLERTTSADLSGLTLSVGLKGGIL